MKRGEAEADQILILWTQKERHVRLIPRVGERRIFSSKQEESRVKRMHVHAAFDVLR